MQVLDIPFDVVRDRRVASRKLKAVIKSSYTNEHLEVCCRMFENYKKMYPRPITPIMNMEFCIAAQRARITKDTVEEHRTLEQFTSTFEGFGGVDGD